MAAWARQEVAQLKNELGDQWGAEIESVAEKVITPQFISQSPVKLA